VQVVLSCFRQLVHASWKGSPLLVEAVEHEMVGVVVVEMPFSSGVLSGMLIVQEGR